MCEHKCKGCTSCTCETFKLTKEQLEIIRATIKKYRDGFKELGIINLVLYYNAQLNLIDELIRMYLID